MELNKEQKQKIKKIGEDFNLKLIILHGSHAKKTLRKGSDLDIAVLGEKSLDFEAELALYSALANIFGDSRERELDVKSLHGVDPFFRYQVMKDGVLLYGSSHDFYTLGHERDKDRNRIWSSEKAQNILNEKSGLILAEHRERTEIEKMALGDEIHLSEENIKVLEKDIERIEIKISSLEAEKKSLEAKVDALQQILIYQQDPGTQFALFDAKEKVEVKKQEIENRHLQINSLEGQINDFKSKINSLKLGIENIRPTSVIRPPTILEEPIESRPLLNMAIAGILGLFVGTFLAFGKEWWEKSELSTSRG
ncbi:MAG: hypothetical protein FJZ07_00020 [Candidatus Nealsonbacteria bacterium]|nr:hypothetical protein [Candidatus Nealsonbacteria bacterium]